MTINPNEVILDPPQQSSGQEIDPAEVIPDSQEEASPQPPEEKPLEALHAGLQGFESGLTLGGSDVALSKGVPLITGESPEAVQQRMRERLERHPIASTVGHTIGSVGSLLGLGELAEGATGVNTAIANLPKWSRLGANMIKGLIEGGLLGAGDEISDSALGKSDPNAAISSALTNIGVSGLMGAGINGTLGLGGMALKGAADAKAVRGIKKFLADFAAQAHAEKKLQGGKTEITEMLANELKNFHESTSAVGDEARGGSGLKSQAINKLAADVPMEKAVDHIGQVADIIDKAPNALKEDKNFEPVIGAWREAVAPVDEVGNPITPTPAQIFKATDTLKRQLQEWGKFNQQITPLADQPFRNAAKTVSHDLRLTLEDPETWGDLGTLQKNYNAAVSQYIPALKDFQSQFTRKIEGDPTVDIGKVGTFYNQSGKLNNAYRSGALKNYLEKAGEFRNQLEEMHTNLGLESPFEESPMPMTADMLNERKSLGAKAATEVYRNIVPDALSKFAVKAASAVTGGMLGGPAGAVTATLATDPLSKYLTPAFEKTIGQPLKKYGIPMALRALSSDSPASVPAAIEYGGQLNKGQYLIKGAINNIFKMDDYRPPYQQAASENDKKKLKKYIEEGGMNAQLNNQLGQMNREPAGENEPPQGYAEGGQVTASAQAPEDADQAGLINAAPEHAQGLLAARGRVYNYLNHLRPQKNDQAPIFDSNRVDKSADRHYDQAVNMAIHPLSILNKVKDGAVDATDMKHFISMYPEMHSYLSKELTKKAMEAHMKGQKPPYKTRQGLSLFLGAPLDSTFSPSSIQAIQATYNSMPVPAAQGGAKGKTRKGTSTLGKSNSSYETASQSAESDRGHRG